MALRSMISVDGGSLVVPTRREPSGLNATVSKFFWSGVSSPARTRPVSISTSLRTLLLSRTIPSRPSEEKA